MAEARSMIEQIAHDAGVDPDGAGRVVELFCLGLRRNLDNYKGINGDYIGERLHWDISNRAFCHLLCFLDNFSEKYQWERGTAHEYVSRLLTEDEWAPFDQEYFRGGALDLLQPSASGNEALGEFISAAHACAMSLMGSASYLETELPKVEMPADDRIALESLCAQWIGTKHDVIHELSELKGNANVEDHILRIMRWLSKDIVKLQEGIRKLEMLAASEVRFKPAYLLVGNAGGDILRSFVAAGESADRALGIEGRTGASDDSID